MDAIELLEYLKARLFNDHIEYMGLTKKEFNLAIKEIEVLYQQIEDKGDD